jgi:molecular chaperone HscA
MTENRPGAEPVTKPADPWPHSPYPPLELAPGVTTRRRTPRWRLWTVVVTAVLAVAAFVVALSWPGAGRPTAGFAFQPLELVQRIDLAQPTDNTFSQLVGGRAYVAWQQGDDLQLAAIDLASNRRVWDARVTGADGQYWGGLIAGPDAVVAYGDPITPEESEEPEPLPMVVLDAATGGERYQWEREIYPDDQVWLVGQTLVLVDRYQSALRGLHVETGVDSWVVRFPGRFGAEAAVVPVFAADQLAGPSTWWGGPMVPSTERLVMVGEDRSARVIDAGNGQVVGAVGTNVADPDDALVAYGSRLLVAAGHVGYQVYARDLADLPAQPALLYTTPDPERGLLALPTPCGEELLCLLDDDGITTELRMVDVSADRTGDPQRWHREVPGAEWLVPVGEWLMVAGHESDLIGFDRDGGQVLSHPEGAAARLDADNLLLFASVPTGGPQDLSVAGVPVGADRVELGQMSGVHGERCSWNATYLVCPGEQSAGIWRFASEAG